MNCKNKYGQYMTPEIIASFMVNLIEHDNDCECLEPCCGEGIFLDLLKKSGYKNITAFEIDKSLIKKEYNIYNKSFVSADIKTKYDVIIGNPPIIRWKNLEKDLKSELSDSILWQNYCNSLCDYSSAFIIKSVEQLKEDGELIFITTNYWFSTMHASGMRNYLLDNGYIKEIVYFNETPIFEKVSASFVIFKFVKNKKLKPDIDVIKYSSSKKLSKDVLDSIAKKECGENYFIPQFEKNTKWIIEKKEEIEIIHYYENACGGNTLKKICDIGNGMVSGLDKAFQISSDVVLNDDESKSYINVIKAKNLKPFVYDSSTRYIFFKNKIDENILKNKFVNFFAQLFPFKQSLLNRYSYGKDLQYWEWAFLRNFSLFQNNTDKIFCPCKERITKKDRFRFSIVPANYYPTQDVTALVLKNDTEEDIRYVTALLNSKYVFKWLSNCGVRKGDIVEFSEAPLASIPYRKINFNNEREKNIHDKIIELVETYKKQNNPKILDDIDFSIGELLKK